MDAMKQIELAGLLKKWEDGGPEHDHVTAALVEFIPLLIEDTGRLEMELRKAHSFIGSIGNHDRIFRPTDATWWRKALLPEKTRGFYLTRANKPGGLKDAAE